ncbi:hypothetical protein D3C79_833350 [compost metagenome]
MGHGAGSGATRQVHTGRGASGQQGRQGQGIGLGFAVRLGAAAGAGAGNQAGQGFMAVAEQAQGRQLTLRRGDARASYRGQHQALPGAQAQAAITVFTRDSRRTAQHVGAEPAKRRGNAQGHALQLLNGTQPWAVARFAAPIEHGIIPADRQP